MKIEEKKQSILYQADEENKEEKRTGFDKTGKWLLFTDHIPRSQNCMKMQFCETCKRQNALKMHFVCIAKRVTVNGVNSNDFHARQKIACMNVRVNCNAKYTK